MCDGFDDHHLAPLDHDEWILDTPLLRGFIGDVRAVVERSSSASEACRVVEPSFRALLTRHDWLPEGFRQDAPESGMGGGIGQWLLFRAADRSLCLFSLVVPPGSETPVHDHLAWGLVGLYEGTQDEELYEPGDGRLKLLRRRPLLPGDYYALLPPRDDVHRVRTTSDVTSVSIHLLANDTGCVLRHTYDEETGEARPFRSGYVNAECDEVAAARKPLALPLIETPPLSRPWMRWPRPDRRIERCAPSTPDSDLLAAHDFGRVGQRPRGSRSDPIRRPRARCRVEHVVQGRSSRVAQVAELDPVLAQELDALERSPHFAHPEVRRSKAEALAARPLERGAAQMQVWDSLREKSARMRVASETGAQADVFDAYRASLDELEAGFPLSPGQAGAVLALGDTLCLDWVSRPEAFEQLWPKLRRGYLLDALEHLDGSATLQTRIAGFVDGIADAPRTQQPSAGLGEDVRLRGSGAIGSGLSLDGELLQLSAFTSTDGADRAFGRIARPSTRR